jgi:peptidoglycan/xylan/chitin deacetylase (PgdA/CDA1 family)
MSRDHRPSKQFVHQFARFPMAPKRLTLTFDHGPTPGVTEGVLDTLAEFDAKATFFLSGSKLAAPGAREIAQRIVDEGHWVGNHTMTDPHNFSFGTATDPDVLEKEIGQAESLVAPFAHPDRLFRPPGSGGIIDERLFAPATIDYLCAGGHTVVLWNSVPRDWADPHGWLAAGLADIERLDWTVLVLHDTPTGAMDHLGELLAEVRSQPDFDITPEFEPSCVPIRRGQVQFDLAPFTTQHQRGA